MSMTHAKSEKNGEADATTADLREALEQNQRQIGRARKVVADMRENDRYPPTPVEVPSLVLLEQARRVLTLHGCGCEACRALGAMLGRRQ